MAFWRNHPARLRAAALLLAAAMVGLVQWLAPQTLAGAEALAGDTTWRVAANAQPERRLVVVDIDEASLRDVGPWPWPRDTVAKLAERLASAGALVQAYDINFSDAKGGDALLRQAFAQTSVVLGQLLSTDATVNPRVGSLAGALAAPGPCPAFAPQGHGFYGTAQELLRANPAVGHLTPHVERDGVVRKLPMLICQDGKTYPSLALTTLWRAAQPDGAAAINRPDFQAFTATGTTYPGAFFAPAAWLTSASLPGLVVPLDEQGNLRVPYRLDRKAFASVSASEVLRGNSDLSLLKGTLVLVGATAFGIGDTVATPHAAVSSGLEVHAQALAGLLDHRLPYEPRRAAWLQILAGATMAAVLLVLATRRRGSPVKRLPVAGLVMAVVCWLGASVLLVQADVWLPWASAALFAVLSSICLATAEHALTRAQRERVSAHLGAYLPAPVAQRLMATEPTGQLQVQQRDISVLVADVRNFSAFAAHRPPEETAAVLHAYCCIAVDVVERFGGVVENVNGVSVLAVWNAFSPCTDHPKQAMEAAKELIRATRQLLVGSQPAAENSPVQPLALGVGLETGSAIVGSFGPTRRRAHAALGEPVSVASRIQQMTLDLSIPILVGPHLAAQLPVEGTEALGEYLLEGLSRSCRLFAPTAWADLVPTDPNWINAATATERPAEPSVWSRWADNASIGPLKSGAIVKLRDA